MFVFGEIQDPNPAAVNLVEDIVRSQVLEIVRVSRSLDTVDRRRWEAYLHMWFTGHPGAAAVCEAWRSTHICRGPHIYHP